MLDLKYVIANIDAVRENCRNRNVPADVLDDIDRIADLEADRKQVLSAVEDVRPAGEDGEWVGAPPPHEPSWFGRAGRRIVRRPTAWARRPWPTDRIVKVTVTGLTLLITTYVMMNVVHLNPLNPGADLVLDRTTPTGGDMGAHVWGPAYLRDHLLPNWQLNGWSMEFSTPQTDANLWAQRMNQALVRFVLDDIDKLQEEAYEKAIADARTRAQRLARLSQVELGPIVAVREVVVPGETAVPPQDDDDSPRKRLETSRFQAIPVRVELLVRFEVHSPAVGGKRAGEK